MHALTIRYRNDLNLGLLFHYCTNVAFLSVVKNEQEIDCLGLSGQNHDDKCGEWGGAESRGNGARPVE